jgi:hypothetical protein
MHSDWKKRYFQGLSLAMNTAQVSARTASRFQASFRMWRVRSWYWKILRNVRLVQRQFRAYQGRRRALAIRITQTKGIQLEFFNFWATAIQRHYRGFYSRKHVHDAKSRRQFLATVAARGQRTVVALQSFGVIQSKERELASQASEFSKLKNISSGLHHLVSTKSIPGVYNPPHPLLVPTISDQGRPTPVETFIKASVKDVLDFKPKFLKRTLYVSHPELAVNRKHLLSVTANVGRQCNPQGPFFSTPMLQAHEPGNFASLQASVPYGRVADAVRLERFAERKLRLGAGCQEEFRVTRTNNRSFLGSVAANAIFQEQTTDSLFRGDYSIMSRLKTFKTAVPRNRFLHE